MREINFLPHEIKDKIFKRKKRLVNYSITFIIMVNIFLVVHIFQGICEINSKEKISNNVESQVLNTNIYREKDNVLGFFQENIVGHFTFEGANFKGSTLNLKIIIKDKSEFSNCVKDLEAIKKCNIVYLIAPYVENNVEKFEAALEVKK